MYSKSKDQFLEIQMQDAQDRNAMAERQYLDEVQQSQTSEALAEAMLQTMRHMLVCKGLNTGDVNKIMQGVKAYGTACQLAMLERNCTVDTFGGALTDEERAYVTKVHPIV
jgi:hypothetical protein